MVFLKLRTMRLNLVRSTHEAQRTSGAFLLAPLRLLLPPERFEVEVVSISAVIRDLPATATSPLVCAYPDAAIAVEGLALLVYRCAAAMADAVSSLATHKDTGSKQRALPGASGQIRSQAGRG